MLASQDIEKAQKAYLTFVENLSEMFSTLKAEDLKSLQNPTFFKFRGLLEIQVEYAIISTILLDHSLSEEEVDLLDAVFPSSACVTYPSLAQGVFYGGMSYKKFFQATKEKGLEVIQNLRAYYQKSIEATTDCFVRADIGTEKDYLGAVRQNFSDLFEVFYSLGDQEKSEELFQNVLFHFDHQIFKPINQSENGLLGITHGKRKVVEDPNDIVPAKGKINLPSTNAVNFHEDRRKASDAVLYIEAYTNKDGLTGTGSGVLISEDGLFVTCAHVVRGSDELYVKETIGEADPEIYRASVLYRNDPYDIALCQMECGKHPYAFLEDNEKNIRAGDEVMLLGYPMGTSISDDAYNLGITYYQGIVSSRQVFYGKPVFYLDCEAKHGNSGGPIFDTASGKVVGLLCGSYGTCTYMRSFGYFFRHLGDKKMN